MSVHRLSSARRAVVLAMVLAGAAALAACVSVRESGNQPAQDLPVVSVRFDAIPDTAEVHVDGEFRGTAPVTLLLAPGTHAVELRLAGYHSWSRELVVVAGNDTRVAARLQPE